MTCAKRSVMCELYPPPGQGTGIIATGENNCLNPQPTCPRLPGEGYEKCQSICHQTGHAEEMAIAEALAKMESGELPFKTMEGFEAHLYGHYYMCERCARQLAHAGITKVVIHVAK